MGFDDKDIDLSLATRERLSTLWQYTIISSQGLGGQQSTFESEISSLPTLLATRLLHKEMPFASF